jgi:hypothetical protein
LLRSILDLAKIDENTDFFHLVVTAESGTEIDDQFEREVKKQA